MPTNELSGKYPAKRHVERVVEWMSRKMPDAPQGVLYLESRATKLLEDNDSPEPFRQRRYFFYMTGCHLADSFFTYDIATKTSTLYIPPTDPDDVIWCGLPTSVEDALTAFDVDEVKYTTELNAHLAHLAKQCSSTEGKSSRSTVFAIANQVSESTSFLGFDEKDFEHLKPAIDACRVAKDDYEVALIKKANDVSTEAHHAAFKRAKHATNEAEVEAIFIERCMANGAKNQAYHGIFAGGTAAATLHYTRNDQPLKDKLNMLIDAGCEWNCYAADITRTVPISGVFSPESRAIYEIVLRMQNECIEMLKADVLWDDVHARAHRVAIDGLLKLGILKGDRDEIFDKGVSVAFFPHGLGHHLGMDVHDVGGNPNPKDPNPMFRYLRLRGTVPDRSVVTVEPGIYFCKFILDDYLKKEEMSKYIDTKVMDRYWDVGGVRIEDNILVTKDGYVNLTSTLKDPEKVENLIIATA